MSSIQIFFRAFDLRLWLFVVQVARTVTPAFSKSKHLYRTCPRCHPPTNLRGENIQKNKNLVYFKIDFYLYFILIFFTHRLCFRFAILFRHQKIKLFETATVLPTPTRCFPCIVNSQILLCALSASNSNFDRMTLAMPGSNKNYQMDLFPMVLLNKFIIFFLIFRYITWKNNSLNVNPENF